MSRHPECWGGYRRQRKGKWRDREKGIPIHTNACF